MKWRTDRAYPIVSSCEKLLEDPWLFEGGLPGLIVEFSAQLEPGHADECFLPTLETILWSLSEFPTFNPVKMRPPE